MWHSHTHSQVCHGLDWTIQPCSTNCMVDASLPEAKGLSICILSPEVTGYSPKKVTHSSDPFSGKRGYVTSAVGVIQLGQEQRKGSA